MKAKIVLYTKAGWLARIRQKSGVWGGVRRIEVESDDGTLLGYVYFSKAENAITVSLSPSPIWVEVLGPRIRLTDDSPIDQPTGKLWRFIQI